MEEVIVVAGTQTQYSLILNGESPIPLVSWIGHTEGVTEGNAVVQVVPASAIGSSFLATNAGSTFSGTNQLLVTQNGSTVCCLQSGSVQVLPNSPGPLPRNLPPPVGGPYPTVFLLLDDL